VLPAETMRELVAARLRSEGHMGDDLARPYIRPRSYGDRTPRAPGTQGYGPRRF
jgi:hypothetical protein